MYYVTFLWKLKSLTGKANMVGLTQGLVVKFSIIHDEAFEFWLINRKNYTDRRQMNETKQGSPLRVPILVLCTMAFNASYTIILHMEMILEA